MTTNRRKKFSRARASHTHGWGSMKKHRGSGHRGGAGNAGSGKRADSNKPSIWHTDYFGRKGFSTRNKEVRAVNIDYVDQHLTQLGAKEESGKYLIELDKKGYQKLLGRGRVSSKLIIKVAYASAKAIESVKKAGGEVLITKKHAKPNSAQLGLQKAH